MLSKEHFRFDLVRSATADLLTARPELNRNFVNLLHGRYSWPVPNARIGTSIESDNYVHRADRLRRPAQAGRGDRRHAAGAIGAPGGRGRACANVSMILAN
jgi:hypothetical protein